MTIKAKKSKINLREKLAELLNFRQIRDRLDGLGLYIGKDRTGSAENVAVRGGANVDDLQLAEISAALGGTAVDVFVYDTRKDSDGGKWRERTSHTSWYNEELNTATRGGRREFPAVAVIVAEANKVTIYDGDDPDLSMWMVFEAGSGHTYFLGAATYTSISILNGKLICASGGGSRECNFISEYMFQRRSSLANTKIYYSFISNRNGSLDRVETSVSSSELIVQDSINDVAMTVLPNAPIDEDTGLPVPTIAVATDGGVSVIKDDGTVVDSVSTANFNSITFNNSTLYSTRGTSAETWRFDDYSSDEFSGNAYHNKSTRVIEIVPLGGQGVDSLYSDEDLEIASANGLSRIHENSDLNKGMLAYTTSTYNTGWMPGDIKLAALSDSVVETVGVNSDELVVDSGGNWVGDFNVSADADAWTVVGAGASIQVDVDNQELIITRNGTSAEIQKTISTEVGNMYLFTCDLNAVSGGAAFRIEIGGEYISTTSDIKTHTLMHFATSTSTVIKISVFNTTSGTITVDNISVRATTELITNGDFSIDAIADDFAETYPEWTEQSGGGASLAVVSGELQITGGTNLYPRARQEFTTVVGQKYVVSATARQGTTGRNVYIYNNDLGSSNITNHSSTTNAELSFTFTATSTTSYVELTIDGTSNGTTAFFDNVSVRPAEEDRSVNNNGLQIIGEINKTPVAPGADLVAYSGFSEYNYLVQPYNEDLDFGTGDFLSTWWIYRNDTLAGSVFHRSSALVTGNTATSDAILQAEFGASQFQAQVYTNGFGLPSDNSTLTYTGVPSGVWTHMAMSRKSNVLSLYVNGKFIDSVQSDATVTNTNAPMSIGTRAIRSGLERPLNGSLALLRFSATAPTPDQIAKIYRDEKALFTDGAQATLYGTSDAVTALSYDEKTELLHVGTSSGRSDFAGLRRINNTTTAITTSISAHNNLIAEQ